MAIQVDGLRYFQRVDHDKIKVSDSNLNLRSLANLYIYLKINSPYLISTHDLPFTNTFTP
jgi:hypothetical protein